jgi:hypothetical protein
MDLSYYDNQSSTVVFPLLLALFKQSCEQSAILKAEYENKHSESVHKQLCEMNCNKAEIYNKLLKLFNERKCECNERICN